MILNLPWPPTINHYYWHRGNMKVIATKGREFRKVVAARIGEGFGSNPVMVRIQAYPPDRRKRDLDNILKALLDALQHGGAFEDDSQIQRLEVVKCEPKKSGYVLVEIAGAKGV